MRLSAMMSGVGICAILVAGCGEDGTKYYACDPGIPPATPYCWSVTNSGQLECLNRDGQMDEIVGGPYDSEKECLGMLPLPNADDFFGHAFKKVGPNGEADAAFYVEPGDVEDSNGGTVARLKLCDWSAQSGIYFGTFLPSFAGYVLDDYPEHLYYTRGTSSAFELYVEGVGAGEYEMVSSWEEAVSGAGIACGDVCPNLDGITAYYDETPDRASCDAKCAEGGLSPCLFNPYPNDSYPNEGNECFCK